MGFFTKIKGHRRISEQEHLDASNSYGNLPETPPSEVSTPPGGGGHPGPGPSRGGHPSPGPPQGVAYGTLPPVEHFGVPPLHRGGRSLLGSTWGTMNAAQFAQAQEHVQDAELAAEEERQLAAAMAASLAEPQPPAVPPPADRTQEERDRQLAIQLAEEENARARNAPPQQHPPQQAPPPFESDEEMARRLQRQLDLESAGGANFRLPLGGTFGGPPPALPRQGSLLSNGSTPSTPSSPIAPVAPHRMGSLGGRGGCSRCKRPLGFGRYLSAVGGVWHPDCFLCRGCNKPIAEPQFSVVGEEPFHTECYKRLVNPTCHVCKDYIPVNANGLIQYRAHPYWHEKYCPIHEEDGTARCCGCERFEPLGEQFIPHEDGRKLCLECCSSVVVDTNDCQPLYKEILAFYEQLGMPLKQAHIPLLLVERQALNEATRREQTGETPKKQGTHHHAETRGLCLSEEQVIQTVRRMPSRHLEPPGSLSRVERAPQVVKRHCEVTAILVLYGLPRLLTGSILTHELMHAWLRLHGGFPRLAPDKEEGICQAMAHLWLQKQLSRNDPGRVRRRSSEGDQPYSRVEGEALSEVEKSLAEFFVHQIAHDSSPVYGGGFRAAHQAITQFGLSAVLEHMRLTANFP